MRESDIDKGGYRRTIVGDPENVLVRARTSKQCRGHSDVSDYRRDWLVSPCERTIEPGDVYLRVRSSWLEARPLSIECALELGLADRKETER
jgi:hypothetical protein